MSEWQFQGAQASRHLGWEKTRIGTKSLTGTEGCESPPRGPAVKDDSVPLGGARNEGNCVICFATRLQNGNKWAE